MKLRQKLVAVVAASMVVTSVPVVTMADSSNNLSVYNYNIKDTTIGFKTTDKVLDGATTKSSVKVVYTAGNNLDGTQEFSTSANLPKLEIKPEYTYTNINQTAFLYLTKDSEFNAEAYLAYADAANHSTGKSNLYVDANGVIQNAHTAGWTGAKATTVLDNGVVLNFTGATITVKVMEISGTEFNDREYKSAIRMDFNGTFNKNDVYAVPFLAKVGGDKEVLAYLDGRDSFVTSKAFTLSGVLSDKKLVATAKSETITVDNIEEIGEIRLDENQVGALADANGDRWIKIKLASSTDLRFNLSKTEANIKATGKRGFFGKVGKTTSTGNDKIEVKYAPVSRSSRYSNENDEQVLLVKLPSWSDNAKGQVALTGIFVEPQDKKASTGDVNVTISEDLTNGNSGTSHASNKLIASTTVKVAEVANYDINLTSTPVDVKAGRSGVVNEVKTTFDLKEAVKDTLVSTRKIEFTLENGYIFGPADINVNNVTSSEYRKAAKARFQELIADETVKFEEDAEAKDGKKGFELTDVEVDANGYVIGFTGYFDRLTDKEDNEIKVTMPVAAPVQAKGEVKLKVGNLFTRSYEKDIECVVAKIVEPIEVTVENAAIKVGLQDQAAGKVTIKETDKGMIERGWMFLSAEDFQAGISFDEVPTVKVVGADNKSLKVENVQLSKDKQVVAFEVTRTSTEASTIEISDIKFTADRTVPEANYDLQIWGDALTDENVLDVINTNTNSLYAGHNRAQYTDMYVVKDFITMTTKNTQDINAEGLKAATASFVIGENKFTVNGESVEMDSAAYIKDNYTMVPVKYVAKAFGIEGNAIQYDQATSTATIIAGSKVIAITAGKANIVVNGTAVPMATKAEVKDGRMCVPMAYIAAALNVQKSWDASTKTATFTNQSK